MGVPVSPLGRSFGVGIPELLFSGPFDLATTRFTITPDGSHFIMVEVDPRSRPTQIHVVSNWAEEVKRAAPASR
jgi:hypothetical protein